MGTKILCAVLALFATGINLSAQAQQSFRLSRSLSGDSVSAPLTGLVNTSSFSNSLQGGSSAESFGGQRGYVESSGAEQSAVQLPRVASAAPAPAPVPSTFYGGVTARDLSNIARHDVVLIIDKSGSMDTQDCPAPFGSLGIGLRGPMRQLGYNGAAGFMRSMGAMASFSPMSGGITAGAAMRFLGGLAAPSPASPANMLGMGRPGMTISRWDWCKDETLDLSRQTSSVLPAGLTVVLFSTGMRTFTHVNLNQVPQIFADNTPNGSTNTDGALRAVFNDYFKRRDESNGNVKPLLVAVITDGLPNDPRAVNEEIERAMRKEDRPGEISITFLQVGEDPDSFQLLRQLSSLPIVATKDFGNLQREGLTRALVDCVSR